jgi:endonuclease YncB( thermonuclease family)
MRGAGIDVTESSTSSGAKASARWHSIARNWLGSCIPTAKFRNSRRSGARPRAQRCSIRL